MTALFLKEPFAAAFGKNWVVVSSIFFFTPKLGEMIPFRLIFFRWVGSTTNFCCVHHRSFASLVNVPQQVVQENGQGALRIFRDVREELVGVKSGQKSGPWFVSFMKASWCFVRGWLMVSPIFYFHWGNDPI